MLLTRRCISLCLRDTNNNFLVKFCSSQKYILVNDLCQLLDINKSKAEYLYLKQPCIRNSNADRIKELIITLNELGIGKKDLILEPTIFNILPITIKLRYQVLQECGFKNIRINHLATYLPLLKKKTIGELKDLKLLQKNINVENHLASYMTEWSTSLTTSIIEDVNNSTLSSLRLKIIQKYLEQCLDLKEEEFIKSLDVYPTIKHRPLAFIHKTMAILQLKIKLPSHKIKSNMFLVPANPNNLTDILDKIKFLGGVDIKKVINEYPKIASQNYLSIMEIQEILTKHGLSDDVHKRCFNIFTLSPKTVRERLKNVLHIPEFHIYLKNPRILSVILYNKLAMKRLLIMYKNKKTCISLNILSGSEANFQTYMNALGDKSRNVNDLLYCISDCFGNSFDIKSFHEILLKHPYRTHVPLTEVKYVFNKLAKEFSKEDIYENCFILLYPWVKISNVKKNIERNKLSVSHLNVNFLSKSQTLSLVVYFLEKDHYFTGDGVWM